MRVSSSETSKSIYIQFIFLYNLYPYGCCFSDAKNMATDVRNILIRIISTKGNMSESDALGYLKRLEGQKRYSADIWS